MAKEILDEREFELVNIIGAKLGSNQRDLSRQTDMSLGLVNMLMRRLIAKGVIRINQLNKKKVEYILTPKGFTEKMRKSVKYTLNTINAIGLIKDKLKNVLRGIVERGHKDFIILGESDFSSLVEIVLRELCGDQYTIKHVADASKEKNKGFILVCKEFVDMNSLDKANSVNLVEVLAKDYAVNKQKVGVLR